MKHFKILFVDDEPDIGEVASSILSRSGHVVDIAIDGREGLAKIKANASAYDLIVTDNSMPNMSGMQMVEQLRIEGFLGKIIVASALLNENDKEKFQSRLVDRIIQKPYRMGDLSKVVDEIASALESKEHLADKPTTEQLKHLNVLVVDDSPQIAKLVSLLLARAGHYADVAQDGQEALTRIKKNSYLYDLIITDNVMPNISGMELVEQLRKDGFAGKIIVMSGTLNEHINKQFLSHGVDKILKKPFTLADFRNAVDETASALFNEKRLPD